MAEPLRVDRCKYEETYYYPDGLVKVVKYSDEETKATEQEYNPIFYCDGSEGAPNLQVIRHISPCSACGKLMDTDGIRTDGLTCNSCKKESRSFTVFVNKVETEYAEFYTEGVVISNKIPEIIKMNVTATNTDMRLTMDIEVDPVVLVSNNGVPDYEETARRVIKDMANGLITGKE